MGLGSNARISGLTLALILGSIALAGCCGAGGIVLLIGLSSKPAAKPTGTNESDLIAYETVRQSNRKLDNKLIMYVLVDEKATRAEVMKLAESLKRKHAGKYSTISIFDSREASIAAANQDMSYPESKLSLHWLVVVEWVGEAGRKDEIRWVAEGRPH